MAERRITSKDQDGDDILNLFKKDQNGGEAIDVNHRVRVGIIGTGWIAAAHMESYLKMPDVDIVAGADVVPEKAKQFFDRYHLDHVHIYTDHREMLEKEKLDAVSVCTYNRAHKVCAVDALHAGVHVLLEKPMGVTLEEAVEICRAEKASGKILSIGFQPRFDPNMRKIKEIVESGELGTVYYIQTGGGRRRGIPVPFGTSFIEDRTAGIGAVGDIGCYSLDMVLHAVGYPKPLTVSGFRGAFLGNKREYYRNHPEYAEKFEVDDFAAAFVRLSGGIILDFRIAWAMHMDTPGDTIILGTKAGLRIPSTECWNGTVGGPMKVYMQFGGLETCMELPILESSGNLFDAKVRSFLNVVKDGGEAPVPSSQILYNQAIIDGIVRSSDLGREIAIEIPEI
ncbi:MAG: Gfo/Idh/MocA family oxidoreductase [Lachnospiraceae bacterium]|nr:Gfo/Idh/MocA family oxidoreductase [Lachnospiraceae bacterium]